MGTRDHNQRHNSNFKLLGKVLDTGIEKFVYVSILALLVMFLFDELWTEGNIVIPTIFSTVFIWTFLSIWKK